MYRPAKQICLLEKNSVMFMHMDKQIAFDIMQNVEN